MFPISTLNLFSINDIVSMKIYFQRLDGVRLIEVPSYEVPILRIIIGGM